MLSMPASALGQALGGKFSLQSPASLLAYLDEADDIKDSFSLAMWRIHGAASARFALRCNSSLVPDLRWPTARLCPNCWGKCFRRGRFCWSPWEDERKLAGAYVPDGFADAVPNHAQVAELLRSRYGGDLQDKSEEICMSFPNARSACYSFLASSTPHLR